MEGISSFLFFKFFVCHVLVLKQFVQIADDLGLALARDTNIRV